MSAVSGATAFDGCDATEAREVAADTLRDAAAADGLADRVEVRPGMVDMNTSLEQMVLNGSVYFQPSVGLRLRTHDSVINGRGGVLCLDTRDEACCGRPKSTVFCLGLSVTV